MIAGTMKIDIERIKESKLEKLDFDNLSFGRNFSDHMFVAEYKDGEWGGAKIIPFGNQELSPASSVLHYGQAVFEGLKAYTNEAGEISLFRPMQNFKRLNESLDRMAMPALPEELYIEGLKQLIQLDHNWIPKKSDSSLYIRPFVFATDDYIGVKPSDTYRFMIITSPVQGYYSEPVKVYVETEYIRAAEGGVGYVKTAGNYGRSLYPARQAQKKGYHQILWTDSKEHKYVEESGTMNLMFLIGDTLVTPPLGGTILPGITRDSVLTLARDWGMKVEERRISIDEVIQAHEDGGLKEVFGTGTAATIAHIILIGYNGKDYHLPTVESREFSNKVAKELDAIKRGAVEDKFSWMYKI